IRFGVADRDDPAPTRKLLHEVDAARDLRRQRHEEPAGWVPDRGEKSFHLLRIAGIEEIFPVKRAAARGGYEGSLEVEADGQGAAAVARFPRAHPGAEPRDGTR